MKRILPVVLIGGWLAWCSNLLAQTPARNLHQAPMTVALLAADLAPERTTDALPPASGDVAVQIDAVSNAKTSAEAMDAYSRGMAIDPNNTRLQEAYLRKMVDLDQPREAVATARRLLGVAPNNGLARAVVAFDGVRQGALPDAVQDIVLAAQKLPDDPFVQKNAGRIFAWYDNTPQPPPLPQSIKSALPDVRHSLETYPAYTDAYQESIHFLKKAQAAARQSGDTNNARPVDSARTDSGDGYANTSSTSTPPAYGSGQYGYDTTGNYYPYPVYYPAPAYDSYPAYYPYPYYGGWSPFFFGFGFSSVDFIFFDHFRRFDRSFVNVDIDIDIHDRFRDRFFDRDRFRGRDDFRNRRDFNRNRRDFSRADPRGRSFDRSRSGHQFSAPGRQGMTGRSSAPHFSSPSGGRFGSGMRGGGGSFGHSFRPSGSSSMGHFGGGHSGGWHSGGHR